MSRMIVTVVLEGDAGILRSVKSKIMKDASNCMESCCAEILPRMKISNPSETDLSLFRTTFGTLPEG